MKRIALTGVLVALVAGTARAQTVQGYGGDQTASTSSSNIILKGVSSSEVIPASVSSIFGNAASPEDHQGDKKDLAKCDKCNQAWPNCCCHSGSSCGLFAEWLFLTPRGGDLVYAARAGNCFDPPTGGAEQIDFGAQSGFSVGFFKDCGACSDISVKWMHFEATEEDHTTPTTGADVILPLLFHPSLVNCPAATSTSARASQSIDFDRVNIDFRSRCRWKGCELDWLVGFGYGQLNQNISAYYDEGFVKANSDIYGYGVRLGGGATYGHGCMKLFTHADLTLLAANVSANYSNVDLFDGGQVDYEQDLDRIIPVLDLEVGLSMDLGCGTMLKFGYLYSMWCNTVTTPSFIEDVQKGDITGNSGDVLSFDGLFVRLEFVW